MTTTLSDMISKVRRRCDMRESQFVTDADIIDEINASLCELDDILIEKNEDYRLTITAGITIANNSTIPLPADFDELRGVDLFFANGGGNPWVTMKQFSMPERNRFNYPLYQMPLGIPLVSYMLQDGYVAIAPAAQSAGTYRLLYTPAIPVLVNTTDPLPYYLSNRAWYDYVVVDVCIKIFNMQQDDPSAFMAQKAELKRRIEAAAGKRDAGAPKCGRNTRRNFNNSLWLLPYGGR